MEQPTRYRELKKMGSGSAVIHLAPIDLKDFGWKFGDMVDVSDCVAISKELFDVKFKKREAEEIEGDKKDD